MFYWSGHCHHRTRWWEDTFYLWLPLRIDGHVAENSVFLANGILMQSRMPECPNQTNTIQCWFFLVYHTLTTWVVGVDYKYDFKRTDVRNIWRTLCSCQANVHCFKMHEKKTIILKGQIRKGLIVGNFAKKMKNIGDPITNTHWVDSWSHERMMVILVCLESAHCWSSQASMLGLRSIEDLTNIVTHKKYIEN